MLAPSSAVSSCKGASGLSTAVSRRSSGSAVSVRRGTGRGRVVGSRPRPSITERDTHTARAAPDEQHTESERAALLAKRAAAVSSPPRSCLAQNLLYGPAWIKKLFLCLFTQLSKVLPCHSGPAGTSVTSAFGFHGWKCSHELYAACPFAPCRCAGRSEAYPAA